MSELKKVRTWYWIWEFEEEERWLNQMAEQLSGGRVRLAAGTLYGALTALCEKGWIRLLPSEEESRKKEYILTPKGRGVLEAELERLRELVASGDAVLKEETE